MNLKKQRLLRLLATGVASVALIAPLGLNSVSANADLTSHNIAVNSYVALQLSHVEHHHRHGHRKVRLKRRHVMTKSQLESELRRKVRHDERAVKRDRRAMQHHRRGRRRARRRRSHRRHRRSSMRRGRTSYRNATKKSTSLRARELARYQTMLQYMQAQRQGQA